MQIRPRRNRQSAAIRGLVRETHLRPEQLVQPLFLSPQANDRLPIESLPGQFRLGIEELLKEIEATLAVGVNSFMVFPAVPEQFKDSRGSYATADDNFYLLSAQRIKQTFPEICLISDVALDPYSSDGHDGIVINGQIDNDESLPLLAAMSVAQAQAGFDILGPSDMMDGRVGAMRNALDAAGYVKRTCRRAERPARIRDGGRCLCFDRSLVVDESVDHVRGAARSRQTADRALILQRAGRHDERATPVDRVVPNAVIRPSSSYSTANRSSLF